MVVYIRMNVTLSEKVHCVYDYWDMTILSGVADHQSQPCYFENIAPGEGTEWFSDRYSLTVLSAAIVDQILLTGAAGSRGGNNRTLFILLRTRNGEGNLLWR